MPDQERQLSLLDLKPPGGVEERARIDWHLYHREEHERIVSAFTRDYGEPPVFWKRLDPQDADLFFTQPENSVLIDRNTGRLGIETEATMSEKGKGYAVCYFNDPDSGPSYAHFEDREEAESRAGELAREYRYVKGYLADDSENVFVKFKNGRRVFP
jgi:hypothetical protein